MDPLVKQLDSYMAEFQKGNLDSFASFYELTHRKIYYISYGLLGQKEDAEDVCSCCDQIQNGRKKFIQPVAQFSGDPVPAVTKFRSFQFFKGLAAYAAKQQILCGFVDFRKQKTFQKLPAGRKQSGQQIKDSQKEQQRKEAG